VNGRLVLVVFTGIHYLVDLKAHTFDYAISRENSCRAFLRKRQASDTDALQRWQNALKDDHGIADAYEIFHPGGVPVCEANTTVASRAANCLGIIRAVNSNARFV
jgi:hypothetical protein